MKITIKLRHSEVSELQGIIQVMFNLNADWITYIDFYNVSTILDRLQKLNFKSNFQIKKFYTLAFSLNEFETFLKLCNYSSNALEEHQYCKFLIQKILADMNKQALEVKQNIIMFMQKQLYYKPLKSIQQ